MPSTTAISLRLPISLLEQIKIAAHERDVPYQSLIKTWLWREGGVGAEVTLRLELAQIRSNMLFWL